jgi:hypothetical protein
MLSASENDAVTAVRAAEIATLNAEVTDSTSPTLVRALGLPSRDEAVRLLAEMKTMVWRAA